MKVNCKNCIHVNICHVHEFFGNCEAKILQSGCRNFYPKIQETLGEDRIISQDFLDGMKAVGKALAKECKKQQLDIRDAENKARYSWDKETIAEMKERLAHCVEMKILAEKMYKKFKHIKEENSL